MTINDTGKMFNTDEHDLLVRLDEKMDSLSRVLESLVKNLDERGRAIEELKTHNLLHKQETDTMWKKYDALEERITATELKSELDRTRLEERIKADETNIDTIKQASIMLWIDRNPKLAIALGTGFILMLNFHDILVPYILGLFGYRTP